MDVGWEGTKVFADWSLLQIQLDTKQRFEWQRAPVQLSAGF